MYRIFLVFPLLFSIACTSTNQNIGNDASPSSEKFAGFDPHYRGSNPDRITGYSRYVVDLNKYEKPISFRLFTFVTLTDSEINAKLTLCGRSLDSSAKGPFSFADLQQPFEEIALRHIGEVGARVSTSGDMLFAIRWTIADVPDSLTKDAPTSFCLVQTKVDVGEKFFGDPASGIDNTLSMATDDGLPPQKRDPLFQTEFMYFVSPERLRQVMEIELLGYLNQVLPTLNGEIVDQCGLFQVDPVESCTRFYSREILIQEEAMRCADDEKDRTEIAAEISRMENRLQAMSVQRGDKSRYYVEQQCR